MTFEFSRDWLEVDFNWLYLFAIICVGIKNSFAIQRDSEDPLKVNKVQCLVPLQCVEYFQ